MVVNAKNTSATVRMYGAMVAPAGRFVSPRVNASMVMFTPCRPSSGVHAPVTTMARPVMEQMTIVSMNVPVMLTRPWRTGSLVLAAAAAIGAEPRPASLLKMPRAIPFCIAMKMVPTTPPVTALGLNAAWMMVSMAPEIFEKLKPRMSRQKRM